MSRKSWDGVELMAALRSGLDRLESRVEEVNALNVFPVPDGDTGTNMLATLKAAIAEGGHRRSAAANVPEPLRLHSPSHSVCCTPTPRWQRQQRGRSSRSHVRLPLLQ
jgi:hypothetical protein